MKLHNIAITAVGVGFFIGAAAVAKPVQQHRPEIASALDGPAKAATTEKCRELILKWNEALTNSMNTITYMHQTNTNMIKRYVGWKETRDELGADSHDMGCPLV